MSSASWADAGCSSAASHFTVDRSPDVYSSSRSWRCKLPCIALHSLQGMSKCPQSTLELWEHSSSSSHQNLPVGFTGRPAPGKAWAVKLHLLITGICREARVKCLNLERGKPHWVVCGWPTQFLISSELPVGTYKLCKRLGAALGLFGWMCKGHIGIPWHTHQSRPKWLGCGHMDWGQSRKCNVGLQHPVLKPNSIDTMS